MTKYLTKVLDWKQDDVTSQYDELPLWSSPFGLLLLDNFPIGKYENYLDIGFGTGFPLIEISQRLGKDCNCYGIDQWESAFRRAKTKIDTAKIENITLINDDASKIKFPENHFDLITSNLGINNFENPLQVLSECKRVLKPSGSLCFTSNIKGTFNEFYEIFSTTLNELGLEKYELKLNEHINHRGTIESTHLLIENAGLKIIKHKVSEYKMRFLNGTSFLNHSFIIVGFIDSWRNMFDEADKTIFFERFETRLNEYAKQKGELNLTIPMIYFECKK